MTLSLPAQMTIVIARHGQASPQSSTVLSLFLHD